MKKTTWTKHMAEVAPTGWEKPMTFAEWNKAYDEGYKLGRDDCAEAYLRNVDAYAWEHVPGGQVESFKDGYRKGWHGQEAYGGGKVRIPVHVWQPDAIVVVTEEFLE